MSKKPRQIQTHDFYCSCCNNFNITLPRDPSKYRERGHIKDIYCFHCKKVTKNYEVEYKQELKELFA